VFPLPIHALVEREREPVAECPGLHETETAAILEAIMTRLSPEDRELLRLRVAEGATNREIATRLGLSRRAVVRRWVTIRRLVRAILGDPPHAAPDPLPAA
jgi:RNA polymerase sigma factor (sigma-70 family)